MSIGLRMRKSFRRRRVLNSVARRPGLRMEALEERALLAVTTFSNTTSIAIPGTGTGGGGAPQANPYPSAITVSGLTGNILDLNVTLTGFSHTFPGDVDVLLVGPGGQTLIIVGDKGNGGGTANDTTNVTVTFDDESANTLDNTVAWGAPGTSVSSRPVNVNTGDTFIAPAPAGPYGDPTEIPGSGATLSSVFDGTNPNGTWQLFVVDDAGADTGQIAGGWSLDITTPDETTTTLQSTDTAIFSDESVTFTATVMSGGNPVTAGTIDFFDGVTALATTVPLDANGQATFTTSGSALGEGDHAIEAIYSGGIVFFGSFGSLTQRVDNRTVVNGLTFTNPGPNTINDNAVATPYPSNIYVTGVGDISDVNVTITGVTHSFPHHINMLLVGPAGQTLILVSNAGTAQSNSNATVTFDDQSPNILTSGGRWSPDNGSATSKPVNFDFVADTFPAPAPAGPFGDPGSDSSGDTLNGTFTGASADGTWSLYVVDVFGGAAGTFASWSLTFTLPGLSLGGVVFDDSAPQDSTFDSANEIGIDGVSINLYADDGDGVLDAGDGAPIDSTTTGGGGLYLFTGLADGDYIVEIAPSNFNGGPLSSLMTSTGAPDPDNDIDNDDNGAPVAGFGVASQAVTLALNSEPDNDGDGNDDTNLTVDFGFHDFPLVSVSVSPSSVAEDGAGNLVYTFTRDANIEGPLTVNFEVGGGATFGDDYSLSGADTFNGTSGTVTFAANASTTTITVNPESDSTVEGDETAVVTVVTGAGYDLRVPFAATGTITNDDTEVTVTVALGAVDEDGAANLVYTITRTGVTTDLLTVIFDVTGGAVFGTDYTQTGASDFNGIDGTVLFGTGVTTVTVTIDPTTDSDVEDDETVVLTIQPNPGRINIGSPGAATGTQTTTPT